MVHSEVGAEVVAAARSGDAEARDQLVALYLPLVYNIVGRALNGHADVDDVVQETMLRALGGLGGLRDPSSFRSWLVAITVNQVRRHWQQERRTAPVGGLREVHEVAHPEPDFADATIVRLGLEGQRKEVAEATRWLDGDEQEVLSLWWLEAVGELTRAEVAAALELTPQHTAVRVQRTKGQLETARVVVRALNATPRCAGLDHLVGNWHGGPSVLWRKRIARHARGCAGCSGHRSALVPAEGLLVGLGLVPVAGALVGWRASDAATPAAFAPTGSATPVDGADTMTFEAPGHGPTGPAPDPAASAYEPAAPAYDPVASAYDPVAPAHDFAAPAYGHPSPSYGHPEPAYDPASFAARAYDPATPAAPAYGQASPAHDPAAPTYDSAVPVHDLAAAAHGPATPAHGLATPAHGLAVPTHGPAGHAGDGVPPRVGRHRARRRPRAAQAAGAAALIMAVGGAALLVDGFQDRDEQTDSASARTVSLTEDTPTPARSTPERPTTAPASRADEPTRRPVKKSTKPTRKPSSRPTKGAPSTPAVPSTPATPSTPTASDAPKPRPTPSRTSETTPDPTPASGRGDQLAAQVLELVNVERATAGCSPVRRNDLLVTAAQRHSDDMAARDYFDHTSPDGSDPGDRITAAGYRWRTYGENIAAGQQTAQSVMDSWMNSPGHRQNILNCDVTEMGVGVNLDSGGPIWTQVFGDR
ncbi:sigma-70 family RNA polymerase sigma factor [Streptomyces sp. SAJ15]|uniref:sigma-70 family RNA polymerase sigma factor n=1 Tax=Streptomyces sp. SAJ15 TaxID=2011095 RepID=UPI001186218D|nr:sigma-70 family RNA polymerase sigma factor [Streptomyces sp. SAJ15]TVL91573.1 RNA polymerase [Streptomyces sp. SAJ15]